LRTKIDNLNVAYEQRTGAEFSLGSRYDDQKFELIFIYGDLEAAELKVSINFGIESKSNGLYAEASKLLVKHNDDALSETDYARAQMLRKQLELLRAASSHLWPEEMDIARDRLNRAEKMLNALTPPTN
jgi:hypothetical protein